MRIGPDIKADWSAVVRCAKPAGWLYFLNGRVWWNDPDCLMLREPLTLDMGRAWGSFIGISGQLHLVSEWLPDLPADRLDVLKRTIPNHRHMARPVDLFEREMPQQWQLTWGDAGGRHDVVALFNWAMPAAATTKSTAGSGQEEPANPGAAKKIRGESKSTTIRVDLERLGMPAGKYVGFDFWRNEFLPEFERAADFELPPGSCKVLALSKVSDHPQIVSTSRHVSQGLVELSDVEWDADSRTLRGKSKVVGNDPYELRLHTGGLNLVSATISADDNGAGATAKAVPQVGQTVRVQIQSPKTRVVAWELRFER
jgi:hypothetical protein